MGIPPEALRQMQQLGLAPPGTAAPEPQRSRRQQQEAEQEEGFVRWRDAEAEPGNRYSYKVRTVGSNTFPSKGEFSQPTGVIDVLAGVDFRFTLTGKDNVRFEVVKSPAAGGPPTTETFWVNVGDEIGGLETDPVGNRVRNFLTGAVLMDFHRGIRPDTGMRASRVIYADAKGNLHQLWQNQVRAPDLWERAGSAPARPRRTSGRFR